MLPSETELTLLHQQLLAGNKRAWAEIAARLFPWLLDELSRCYPRVGDEACMSDATTQALARYAADPGRYQPERATLKVYLSFRTRTCLANLLRQQARRRCREFACEPKKLGILVESSARPEYLEAEHAKAAKKLQRLLASLHFRDRMFLTMYLWGVRRTDAYARLLGLPPETPDECKRREYKRNYDRIIKELQRLATKTSLPEDISATGILADILERISPFLSFRDVLEKDEL